MIDYYSYFPSIVSSPRYHFAAISLRLQCIRCLNQPPDARPGSRPRFTRRTPSRSRRRSRASSSPPPPSRSLARSLALKNPARNRSDRIITESARRTSFVRSSARRRRRSRSRPREGLTTDARARIPWASVATSCADGRTDGRRRPRRRGRHRLHISASARSDIRNVRVLFITPRRKIHGIRMRAVDLTFYKSPLSRRGRHRMDFFVTLVAKKHYRVFHPEIVFFFHAKKSTN